MFKKVNEKEISEVVLVLERKSKGQKIDFPEVKNTPNVTLLKYLDKLLSFEELINHSTKGLLDNVINLSDFDVESNYLANNLTDLSSELSLLSESNLAIVEETNASMGMVNDIIFKTSETLTDLTKSAREIVKKIMQGRCRLKKLMS